MDAQNATTNKSAGHESKKLTIIHFNDVYNLSESAIEPVGGAARFVSAVRALADRKPLILFSGDCLGPSGLAKTWKGKFRTSIYLLLTNASTTNI